MQEKIILGSHKMFRERDVYGRKKKAWKTRDLGDLRRNKHWKIEG